MKTPNTTNDYPKARMDSLPFSLRHCARWEALKHAQQLTALLDHVNFMQQIAAECSPGKTIQIDWPSLQGMELVINLLRDKLDIAAGAYRFPFGGLAADYPKLAERVNPDDVEGGDA